MEFASEMVVKATLNGLRIAEVPTTLARPDATRASHLRPWRDGWRHLRFLLLYSPRWLFLFPGVALITAGGTVTLLLLPGPQYIGSVGFDVSTMLFAGLAVLLGVQLAIVAVLAKLLAA